MYDRIKWTDQAKIDHDMLQRRASFFARIGFENHKWVRTFRAIEEAVKQSLPNADFPGHMRAGVVGKLYGVPLESAVLWYKVDAEGTIHILLIDSDHKSLMPIVRRELELGKLNRLLRALGIKPPLDEITIDDETVM